MCFAFVSISKEPVSRRPKQDGAGAYSEHVTVPDSEEVRKIPFEIENYSASMVETPRVISSNTSSRTFTVSSAVKIVTLFSTAVRRIS